MELKNNGSIMKQIVSGAVISLSVTALTDMMLIIKGLTSSTIDVGEWDNSYSNINKMLYKLNPSMYSKHRMPTTNKEFFELNENTSYFIRLKNKNFIRVETYRDKNEKSFYPEHKLKLTFLGKERYYNRKSFFENALKLTDKNHIHIKYLNELEMSYDAAEMFFEKVTKENVEKENDKMELSVGCIIETIKEHKALDFMKIGDCFVIKSIKPTGIVEIAKAENPKYIYVVSDRVVDDFFKNKGLPISEEKKENTVTNEQVQEIIKNSKIDVRTVYGKCTIVTVQLPNGFVLVEYSACVDPKNYDEKLGREICMKRIRDKVWELEGYKLQNDLTNTNK